MAARLYVVRKTTTRLRLLKLSDPKLRLRSREVAEITGRHRAFAEALLRGMDAFRGVGLAAPQVGENVRMAAVRMNTEGPGPEERFVIVNPVLEALSGGLLVEEEGCLSIPGLYGPTPRYRSLRLRYTDIDGARQVRDLVGFDARIAQHETDHLDGTLYIDRVEDKGAIGRVETDDEA